MHCKKLHRIGGTNVFKILNKTIIACKMFILIAIFAMKPAYANEITAIDFNGEVIGTVIPDGSVIGSQNNIVGKVTADSFIVNNNGEIIGGVVPQGVVIGNDNKLLGKVNNDGTVRLPTGKVIAKVLPNALVVDDSYNIIGSVLYPGLIYDDDGKTIGRLTGDGLYVSIDGQNVGFVSSLGYAYKNNAAGYVLDGRLISSKMVVSSTGEFIGSVVPGGKVTDFDAKIIGNIHANGYVYNENKQIIGKAVVSGYAFDNYGKYLGFISYNGEVINKGAVNGRLRADDKIVDNEGNVIGFYVDISATATDFSGKYLGRVLPEGKVAKTREIIGTVGAKGFVYNQQGQAIGQIVYAGPIFDYLGNFTAMALRNGTLSSVNGTLMGYLKGQYAYDNIGRMIGSRIGTVQVISSSNNILGLSGIGSEFKADNVPYKISPYGYVYSADNYAVGTTLKLSALYKEDGAVISYIDVNGKPEGIPTEKEAKLNQYGMIIDNQDNVLGYSIDAYYAMQPDADTFGRLAQNNIITDNNGDIISKIVPEYRAITSSSEISSNLMPVIGYAGENYIAVGFNGNMLGYARYDGKVFDFQNNLIGYVVENDYVVGIDKSLLGKLVGYNNIVGDDCSFIGIVSPKGDIRNTRDVVIGKILSNGQVVSDAGNVSGFAPLKGIVTGFNGENIGTISVLGRVLNYSQADIGCIRSDGRLYNSDNVFKGAVVVPSPVISYEDIIIGRVLSSGKVVNTEDKIIGHILPNGNIVSQNSNKVIAMAFKYKVAFDNDNNFMGRINEKAEVISSDNKVLAKVRHDGTVVSGRKEVGYALYDVYVYDENNKAIGYISKGGIVNGFSGNRIGQADRGFLLDKNHNLIGRGSRDYFIRNRSNEIIGELLLDGDVVDNTYSSIGELFGNGEVRSAGGKLLARAYYLQYYNIQKAMSKTPEDLPETKIKMGEIVVPERNDEYEDTYENQDKPVGKYGLKAIGIALTPDGNYLGEILENNDVLDRLGNLIGKKMPDGLIIDNQGGLVGIEEIKNTSADKMFVPAGSFGDGGAYGTGNKPNNLGPGGGYGVGERYDPVRAQILGTNQNLRREELSFSKISTGFSKESFDGMQSSWDGVPRKISTWRVDMSEMILADKPIPAVLSRTIMSGAENVPVTAIVERNVYAEVGRNIVIPAGSRVMGSMSGIGGAGESGSAVRVNITWERLIRPDGSAFEFADAQTGDAQGRAGALGYIDQQLLKKYAMPLATSFFTSAVAYAFAGGENSSDGNGGSVQDARSEAAADARENFIDGMEQIFDQILESKTNISAVAYVPAGTRLIIYPKVDLWIRSAAREKEESIEMDNAPGPLIDGKESERARERTINKTSGGSSSGSSSGSSKVEVYGGDSGNAEPAGNGLLTEEPVKKKQQRVMPAYASPPPPSTGVIAPPPSNSSATLF